MYFGSRNGAFRIYPARQSEVCGSYDPRLRPWYVAAGSGPKNVIMILDKSGSMLGTRIELLKEAATRVVDTLTVSDRVALVLFNDGTQVIADPNGYMYIATDDNKQTLRNAIDQIAADGQTNFYDAFNEGFDILNRTATEEFTLPCNTVILFLTDGLMTQSLKNNNDSSVLELVTTRIDEAKEKLGKPVFLFTYSVSETEEDVDNFPSKLACAVDYGVWSKVAFDSDIVESLSSYYQLFALGLGTDANKDFVAWVEPYTFATGNVLGTSVSKPVYDRSKSPYLFLGVVAMDFSLAAMDAALGIQSGTGSLESIHRVTIKSSARCPSINLSLCELESYRRIGSAGDDALCTDNCTSADFVQVQAAQCPSSLSVYSEYPTNLWVNSDLITYSFSQRVCCKIGEANVSAQCVNPQASSSSSGRAQWKIVVPTIIGAALFVALASFYIYSRRKVVVQQSDNGNRTNGPHQPRQDDVSPNNRIMDQNDDAFKVDPPNEATDNGSSGVDPTTTSGDQEGMPEPPIKPR